MTIKITELMLHNHFLPGGDHFEGIYQSGKELHVKTHTQSIFDHGQSHG